MNPTVNPPPVRCGRLAPSPTGALHIGNLRTFMIAWLQMRACGGQLRLRIEDIDHPKHKKGAEQDIIETLQWLTFDWDGPIVYQSTRTAYYREQLLRLAPHLYPCTCTRADIQHAQSAPHPGEILRYPGTCRTQWHAPLSEQALLAAPALRFALTANTPGTFCDGMTGEQPLTAAATTGDFIVARKGEPAYALAVVADDAAMGITDVVRGEDILLATPAQVVLYQALHLPCPTFYHVPLVVGADGKRLAKRHGDTRIAAYRAAGYTPGDLLTRLARTCGWLDAHTTVTRLAELIPFFNLATLPKGPLTWTALP